MILWQQQKNSPPAPGAAWPTAILKKYFDEKPENGKTSESMNPLPVMIHHRAEENRQKLPLLLSDKSGKAEKASPSAEISLGEAYDKYIESKKNILSPQNYTGI